MLGISVVISSPQPNILSRNLLVNHKLNLLRRIDGVYTTCSQVVRGLVENCIKELLLLS